MPLDQFDSSNNVDYSQDSSEKGTGLVDHVLTTWGKAVKGTGTAVDYAEVAAESILGTSLLVAGSLLSKGEGPSLFERAFRYSDARRATEALDGWEELSKDLLARANLSKDLSLTHGDAGDKVMAEAAFYNYGRLLGQSVAVRKFPYLTETEAGELVDRLQMVPPRRFEHTTDSLAKTQRDVLSNSARLWSERDPLLRAEWFNDRAEAYRKMGSKGLAQRDLKSAIESRESIYDTSE